MCTPMKTRVVDKDVEEHDEEEHDLVQDDPVQHLLQDRLGQCDTTSADGNDLPLNGRFGHLGADEISLIIKHLPDGVLVFALVCTTFRVAVQRHTGSRQMWSTVAHVSCILCRTHACVRSSDSLPVQSAFRTGCHIHPSIEMVTLHRLPSFICLHCCC